MFGISLGFKKQKSSTTTDLDKTETLSGTQSTSTTGTQQSNTTQTGQQSSTSQGTAINSQETDQKQTGTTAGKQTGTTTSLSDSIRQGLEAAINGMLGSVTGSGTNESIAQGINSVQDFDSDQYVADVMRAAETRGTQQLQETNAGIQSAIGGTAGTNSMAALLAARGSNDLSATLSGVRGEAEANAAKIRAGNLGAAAGAQGVQTQGLAQIVEALKGGSVSTDQVTLQETLNQLLGTNTGTTRTAETNQTNTAQQTATTELLNQIVNAITNQVAVTDATEKSKSKGTSFGGGLSAG